MSWLVGFSAKTRQGGWAVPEAMEACMAMKPEERPMSLTKPMPWLAELLSTLAASKAVWASSTAVSNPKHLSICNHSQHSWDESALCCGTHSASWWCSIWVHHSIAWPFYNTACLLYTLQASTIRYDMIAGEKPVKELQCNEACWTQTIADWVLLPNEMSMK